MSPMFANDRHTQHEVSALQEMEAASRPAAFTPFDGAVEKARMYEAERAQRLLFQAALESVPLGVAIVDGRTLVLTWANRSCREQLSRISRVEGIEGRHLSDVIPGSDENGLSEIVRRVATTGRACADLAFEFPGRSSKEGEQALVVMARFSLRKVGGYDGGAGEVMLQITELTGQAGSRGRSRRPAPELRAQTEHRDGMV